MTGDLPLGISLNPLAPVPDGYRLVDVERIVGRGGAGFDRLVAGLLGWEVHERSGISVEADGPARAGLDVLLHPRRGPAAALRLTAPCRVVTVVDGRDEHGFAYVTLPGHPERGEQSFVVWRDGDEIRARLRSVSRPGSVLTRLAGPIARSEQDRAVGRYLDAMRDLARGSS